MMEIFKETMRSKPKIRIGKKSITDTKIEEIKNLINKHSMIKIKILQSKADEIDLLIANILSITKYNLLDIRGSSFVLSKKLVKNLRINNKCKKIISLSKNI